MSPEIALFTISAGDGISKALARAFLPTSSFSRQVSTVLHSAFCKKYNRCDYQEEQRAL